MILPNCLKLEVPGERDGAEGLLGDTGISMDPAFRPASSLASWIDDELIPEQARDVLESERRFIGIAGLLRWIVERDGRSGDCSAAWLLARTPGELVSIVVRDAWGASTASLEDGQRFALQQAHRYHAHCAVLLMQSADATTGMSAFAGFLAAHGLAGVRSEGLYAEPGAGLPLYCAWLSGNRRIAANR